MGKRPTRKPRPSQRWMLKHPNGEYGLIAYTRKWRATSARDQGGCGRWTVVKVKLVEVKR